MRSLPAPLALALLCFGLAACGSSTGTGTASAPRTVASTTSRATTPPVDFRKADRDKDNDIGTPEDDTSDTVLAFGHAAGQSERRPVLPS